VSDTGSEDNASGSSNKPGIMHVIMKKKLADTFSLIAKDVERPPNNFDRANLGWKGT
jgi:hypothetical protein